MELSKKANSKTWSPKIISSNENQSKKDSDDSCHKAEFAQVSTNTFSFPGNFCYKKVGNQKN